MTAGWRGYLEGENVGDRIPVCTLIGGEEVYRRGRSLVVSFPNRMRAVLSSANYNGGYFDRPSAVFNTTGIGGPAEASLMGAGVEEHRLYSAECARIIGLDPSSVVGLGTAVTMDKAAVVTKKEGATAVSAIVTAGVEGNGGRAGDPASYDQSKKYMAKKGTIVIILVIHADIPQHSMARAIVTATEAKTCALQQLMASSVYSSGIASGSGTDQIAIVCDRGSDLHLTDAGKHSLLGELIGKCVIEGVTQALDRWANLNSLTQRDVMRRLARYKVTKDVLMRRAGAEGNPEFSTSLDEISVDGKAVAYVASAIHIVDEIGWGLLDEAEGRAAGYCILAAMLEDYGSSGKIDKQGAIIDNIVCAMMYIAGDMAARRQGK